MAIVLGRHLEPAISSVCVHVVKHDGAKKAVRDVSCHFSPGSHVMKSDVQSYYASIDHMLLFDSLSEQIHDRYVLGLLWQYLKRTVRYGENYRDVTRSISLGCPLSPLMATLFLKPLDDAMQDAGFFYVHFMDDWIVTTPSRWKLHKAVKQVNKILEELLLDKHPDKTFIGKAVRGFDFLGYHFGPQGLKVATDTWKRYVERAVRLYEQEPGEPYGSSRFWLYIKHWLRWAWLV